MTTLTESQQAALETLDEQGRACANPASPCTRPATLRVAATMTEGTPRTVLMPMCGVHTRRALRVPIRNATVVHVRPLPEA